MKLNFIGAYDRHNYGDILFAVVHTRVVRSLYPNCSIKYYATSEADLTKDGGYKTLSLKHIDSEIKSIVVGGDVLAATWIEMEGHIASNWYYFILQLGGKLLGKLLFNDFLKRVCNKKERFPYVLQNLNNLYYTGVSGSLYSSEKHLKAIIDILKTAKKISVRDEKTYRKLSKVGLESLIYQSPDTALVMSDVFSTEELEGTDYKKNMRRDNNFDDSNYVVFQIAYHYLKDDLASIVSNLTRFSQKNNTSVFLVPIGRATGHLDHLALEEIFTILKRGSIPVAILDSTHIVSIMAALANSKMYIGTSLHGAITSYSFKLKVCALRPSKVLKLSSYLQTWLQPKDFALAEVEDLESKMSELFSDKVFYSEEGLKAQKKMVYDDIKNYLS